MLSFCLIFSRDQGRPRRRKIENEDEDEHENDLGATQDLDRINKPGFFSDEIPPTS